MSQPPMEDFLLGPWHVSPSQNRLRQGDETRSLEPRVMGVLLQLAARPGQTVSRTELLDALWDVHVTEHTLNRSLWKLRRALDDDPKNPRFIETIPKVGYRLLVEVEKPASGVASAPGEPPQASRRSRWRFAAGLGVIALFAGLVRFASLDPGPPPSPRPRPLTAQPGYESAASFSPQGRSIVYQNYDKGLAEPHWDLYLIEDLDQSTAPVRLTDDPGHEIEPAWSPDGTRIAFVHQHGEDCAVILLQLATRQRQTLASCEPGSHVGLSWHPSGDWLAVAGLVSELVRLDPATGDVRPITSGMESGLRDVEPAHAADGRLAFVREMEGLGDLFVLGRDGRVERRTRDGRVIARVAWSEDDRWLYFSSNRHGQFALWRVLAEGGEPEPVNAPGRNLTGVTIARAGQRLIYEEWTSDTNVWELDLESDARRALTRATRWDWAPRLAPDGERFLFVSDRDGTPHLFKGSRDVESAPRALDGTAELTVGSGDWLDDGGVVFDARGEGERQWDVFVWRDGTVSRLTETPEDERVPSAGADGPSVLYAARREGEWSVYRHAPDGAAARLVTDAYRALELRPGEIYFTRLGRSGVWRLLNGLATRLTETPPADLWNAWDVDEQGLFTIRRTPEWDFFLERTDLASGETTVVAQLDELFDDAGLSIDHDGRSVLFSRIDRSESDLWLLEPLADSP